MECNRKIILLIINILLLVSVFGCSKNYEEFNRRIENKEIGLCYRDDIKQDEIGFLINNPSRQEVLERLGCPLMSNTFMDKSFIEDGKIIGYFYTYSLDTSALNIYFDLDYNIINIFAPDITKEIYDISVIEGYDRTKFYKQIRYNINEDELVFIKKGVNASTVQDKLGAPHAYLYKTISIVAKDTVSDIFLYKLNNEKVLYFIYKINGEIREAGFMDEQNTCTSFFEDR